MNKLYPWLPLKQIDHTYYFLVTCKTVNPTVNYKEIEDIVCINKYSRRFLEESNAEFIVYNGAEVETVLNDVILSFDKYQAIHKVVLYAEDCVCETHDRKNWIPYYDEFHDCLGSIEYTDIECYPRVSERHVIVNNEFITSYESEGNSNEGYQNYVYFKIPTHLNKDQSLFLYTPHQIYNLYINFIMSKEEIKEFIYKLEKARILNVVPISVV